MNAVTTYRNYYMTNIRLNALRQNCASYICIAPLLPTNLTTKLFVPACVHALSLPFWLVMWHALLISCIVGSGKGYIAVGVIEVICAVCNQYS